MWQLVFYLSSVVWLYYAIFGLVILLWMSGAGLEVIKLEFILSLKMKRNDWLPVDMYPQGANHCVLF